MIDKLDLRIPQNAVWRPRIERILSFDPWTPSSAHLQSAIHYEKKTDLRAVGIDAILHFRCRHGAKHSKLEILDTGKKPYSEIVSIIERVAKVRLDRLGIMRIDLTADLPGVTVPWLKPHVRFKFKRTEREYGQLQYGLVGHGEVETIIAGSRPNVLRIYNKTKECLYQFRRMQRQASPDADPLEFEKEFGLKETDILTRIERQIGGSRIPPEIANFRSLRNLPGFNPFDSLEIITSGESAIPSPAECNGLDYFTGIGLNCESKQLGMNQFRKMLNKQTKGNAARTIQRYREFFSNDSGPTISIKQVVEAYRQSTIDQLAS
jgi:hypothetical protein